MATSSPWSQTNWAGGSGQTSWSDATKFSSSSNVTTSTANQVALTATSSWCSNTYCNSSWGYRRKVTFNNTDANLGVTSEALTNFPVLVKLTSSNIDYSKTQSAGQDIRFTDSSGNDLAYEIEKWDGTATSWVWVKVSSISINSSTDYMYMYYGNSSATDHQQATSVWDLNYQMVQHLKETSGITTNDSTSNGNSGTKVSATSPNPTTSGQFDGAQSFDGTTNISLGNKLNGISSTATSPWTLSAWIKTSAGNASILGFRDSTADNPVIDMELGLTGKSGVSGSGKLGVLVRDNNGTGLVDVIGTTALNDNNWHYVTATRTSAKLITIYVDGLSQNTGTDTMATAVTTDNKLIGDESRNTSITNMNGIIDEVRVSSSARSAAWVAATYKSETDAFNTYAAQEGNTVSSGTLTSSIFDSGQGSDWGTLTYAATTPANTSITVKVRTGNQSDLSDATAFTSCTAISSGSTVGGTTCATNNQRYVQYQLSLANTDSVSTPTFTSFSLAFTPSDTTPPAISLNAVSSPTTNTKPPVTGTATDTNDTVASVQFQMDATSGSWTACTANDGSFNSATENFTCTPGTALSDGSHTMYVRATDSNNNTTTNGNAATATFTVDTTAPTTPGTPSTTSPTNNTTPTWTWTASTDATSGLATHAYTVQWSQSSTFSSGVSSSTATTNSFTHSTALTAGTWYFRVLATDQAGNASGYSPNGTVVINTTAPTGSISINSGAGYTNTTAVTLTLSATDDSDSASQLQMEISNDSGFSGASYESYATSKSWTLTSTDGSKTVYARFKDTAGNVSTTYSAAITFDATSPTSLSLDSPGDNSYTSSDRSTFRFRIASDATSGMSKYKLDVNNGDSGSFTVDSIPTSGTTDTNTNKYTIHFDSFGDSDTTDDYISVSTKSTPDWSSDNNDGKVKEGKRSWTITAYDNAGNTQSASRTLFVDRTAPNVEVTQINDTKYSSNGFTTNDQTPTIYGKITDSLAGDKTENKISSAPKNVEVKIEKKNNLGLYDLQTLATVNLNETYWTSDGSKITDNSQNKSDKYSTFEFKPTTPLPLGNYRVLITGKDNADNSGSAGTFYLNIVTYEQVTTPEEKQIVEEGIKPLTPEQKEKVKEELKITKPTEPIKPTALETTVDTLTTFRDNLFKATVSLVQNISGGVGKGISIAFNGIGQGIRFTVDTTGRTLAFAGNTTGKIIAFVGHGIQTTFSTTSETIAFVGKAAGNGISALYNGTMSILAYMGQGIGNGTNAVGQGLAFAGEKIGQGISSLAQGTGTLLATIGQGIGNTGKAIGQGYNQLANNAPGVTKTILIGIGSGVSTTTNFIASATNSVTTTTVKIAQGTASTIGSAANTIATATSTVANNTTKAIGTIAYNTGNAVSSAANGIGNVSVSIASTTSTIAQNTSKTIGNVTGAIAKTTGDIAQKTGSAIANATQNTVKATKSGIANIAFVVGERTEDVSRGFGTTIIQIGYLFVPEPTRIANVKVVKATSTSMTIAWETNHPANGKVNYGLTVDYGQDTQSDKRTFHHEFTVTGLKPKTTYYYEVMSQNKNYVYDANHIFTTPAK